MTPVEGKVHIMRDGELTQPVQASGDPLWPWTDGHHDWWQDGRYTLQRFGHPYDIIGVMEDEE